MFVDWLTLEQEHADISPMGREYLVCYDMESGAAQYDLVKRFSHAGSYESSLLVRCDGRRVEVSGNPSRWQAPDNLFGVPDVQAAMVLYNQVLSELGLPPFSDIQAIPILVTERQRQRDDGVVYSGCRIKRIDITQNFVTGSPENARQWVRWLSSRVYRGEGGHMYPNGATVDWLRGSRRKYVKYYIKAMDKRGAIHDYGDGYGDRLREWIETNGVVRHEVSLKYKALVDLGLEIPRYCTPGAMRGLLEAHEMHGADAMIRDFEEVFSMLVAAGYSARVANKLQGLVYKWAGGGDVRQGQSKTTLYRDRKILLVATGLDIFAEVNVIRMPIRTRVIEVRKAEPPPWYWRKVA